MLKITKRNEMGQKQKMMIRLFSLLLVFVVSAVFLLILGLNPITVYLRMIKGTFGSTYRFNETIIKTIPILITSLGVMIAFKMKFWNIGGEGQITMGAFAASYFALFHDDLPQIILLPVMFVAAAIAGAIWALIPAFFKARMGANETILTLMMNYIALKWITWLQFGPWKDPGAMGFPKIAPLKSNAVLPRIFGIHIGLFVAVILVVLVYFFMKRSKNGYEIAVLGESEDTARYAGMNIRQIIIIALLLSGGICGITGMIQASGVSRTLHMNVSGGYGFTAIITAWLSGLNPLICSLISFLFAILIQGGEYIQSTLGISNAIADSLQGMILFFILGSEFFVKYQVRLDKRNCAVKTKAIGGGQQK